MRRRTLGIALTLAVAPFGVAAKDFTWTFIDTIQDGATTVGVFATEPVEQSGRRAKMGVRYVQVGADVIGGMQEYDCQASRFRILLTTIHRFDPETDTFELVEQGHTIGSWVSTQSGTVGETLLRRACDRGV